jgi:hypothetical protein
MLPGEKWKVEGSSACLHLLRVIHSNTNLDAAEEGLASVVKIPNHINEN